MKSNTEIFKDSFPDAKELTDKQRENLLFMMGSALVELRMLCWEGKSEQAADLAGAFHNLPNWMTSEVFSFNHFRDDYLQAYCKRYPSDGPFNYLFLIDKIAQDEDLNDY